MCIYTYFVLVPNTTTKHDSQYEKHSGSSTQLGEALTSLHTKHDSQYEKHS